MVRAPLCHSGLSGETGGGREGEREERGRGRKGEGGRKGRDVPSAPDGFRAGRPAPPPGERGVGEMAPRAPPKGERRSTAPAKGDRHSAAERDGPAGL